MSMQPNKERTLVILKPDAVQRSLMGEIVRRFEQVGLKFVGFKFFVPDEKNLLLHYNKDDEWFENKGKNIVNDLKAQGREVEKEAIEYGKDIIRTVTRYMQQGPVLAFVLEGNQSVAVVKKLVGSTEPSTSDVGTIRGDYTLDSYAHSTYENRAVRNLIHCSDSPEEAVREIKIWFDSNELMNYTTAQERIMYDVNLDGSPE